ncbi:hypothetical protein [Streptomyces sp. NPDC088739]|uniref:hypothetical protein n=1 Tax=Streptomyces sp. NPDC088739 TaxID=3365882 RepID=UPI003817813A
MTTDHAAPLARDIDDVLATIDDVLAVATVPLPAVAPEPAPLPEAVPVVDQAPVVESAPVESPQVIEPPTAPTYRPTALVPTPAEAPNDGWWDNVYDDDKADLDTFTGTPRVPLAKDPAPSVPVVPALPATPPATPTLVEDSKDPIAEDGEPEAEDGEPEAEDGEEAADVSPTRFTRVRRIVFAPRIGKGDDGPALTYRGRRALFAATAAGAGWTLGLYDGATAALDQVVQHTGVASAVIFGGGVIALVSRTKAGCALCAAAIGLATAINTFPGAPAYLIGGAVAVALQGAYRAFRHWTGQYGTEWYWRAVAWLVHVPAATTTLAVVSYGAH